MYCPSNITNIQQVFKSISSQLNQTEKHFKKLIVYETKGLKVQDYLVLNDSSFWDITFDEFYGNNIKLISNNAFGQGAETVNTIYINCILGYVDQLPPLYDIWKVLSSLVNIQHINVNLNITEIPSQAFMPFNGKQSKFNSIILYTPNAITIKKMAFFHLENLNHLHFHSDISKIQNQAFAISKSSSEKLSIDFFNNIDGDSFEPESFQGLQRSVQINFYQYLNYVPESSFKTILDNQNNIFFQFSYIDCKHCKNLWMIRDEREKHVIYANCNHNHSLTLFHSQVRYDLFKKCQTNFTLNF